MSSNQRSSKQHRVRVATRVLNKCGCKVNHIKAEEYFEVQFPSERAGAVYRPNEDELIRLAISALQIKRGFEAGP